MVFKCGTVVVVGQPNAGKSTLFNQLLGGKLAITSSKPQTTRNRIVGLYNDESTQLILVDTPGLHQATTKLNRVLVKAALRALDEADVVAWIVDAAHRVSALKRGLAPLSTDDHQTVTTLATTGKPVVLVLNKVDITQKQYLLPLIQAYSDALVVHGCVPLSALTGDGLSELLAALREPLPEHPPLFPKDQWAQVTERFLAAEIIREKIFECTTKEVPYATFVEIQQFDERARETKQLVRIFARIVVQRASQKGILIGKGGSMLKHLGTLARTELAQVLGCRVYLNLFVAVEPGWAQTAGGLRQAGLGE